MPHGVVSELMPASSAEVFDLLHDYSRRLEWDTLLHAAYLEEGFPVAAKGAISVCSGRWSLGGISLRTVYVTFDRPRLAAVKMLNSPPFFQAWAASISHEDLGPGESRVTYTWQFSAKPRVFAFLLGPILSLVFRWETRRRLKALRAFLYSRGSPRSSQPPPSAL